MTEKTDLRESDTVVLGAGQAGLAVSYYLTQDRLPHVVLEQDFVGATWQNKRWDSFTLVTPNWMNQLPGFAYRGNDPDGFLPRAEVVSYLQDYARSFGAPVASGVRALKVSRESDGRPYRVETTAGAWRARNVVVATGYFTRERIPEFAARIPKSIVQIASGEYRNPGALPPGAVLVVGSGQTGCQIAEELLESGRRVYLAVGSAGRQPRRYRGKDICWWIAQMGIYGRSFENPAAPVERYRANPMCSGKNGGHALNLEKFAADGMTLLGHVQGLHGSTLVLAPGVGEAVAKSDQFSKWLMKLVDGYIQAKGLDTQPANEQNTDDGVPARRVAIDEVAELDLAAHGISSIVWSTGFMCDFSWIELPVFDDRGYPVQTRGVTGVPGLYFCGLHWLHCLKSGLIYGVGEDAQHVTQHLKGR
jgi:putative flavoprotein involved in K+ transport